MARLCVALRDDNRFEMKRCVTAQHREMLDQVLNLFDLTSHFDLDVMRANQSLTYIMCPILQSMRTVLNE